jgi:hypothetical protein
MPGSAATAPAARSGCAAGGRDARGMALSPGRSARARGSEAVRELSGREGGRVKRRRGDDARTPRFRGVVGPIGRPNSEPAVGIEPTTARLRIECSTTELRWHVCSVKRPRCLPCGPRLLRSPGARDTLHSPRAGLVHVRIASCCSPAPETHRTRLALTPPPPLTATACAPLHSVPWRGLEPRRLTAPPPQDGVSTNSTTRASHLCCTGLTGLEPATSGVTDRHSNQLSYSPNIPTLPLFFPLSPPPWLPLIAPRGVEPLSAP